MGQITLNVPDKRLLFFLELINQLGNVEVVLIQEDEDYEVPEEHKRIIRERMSKPQTYRSWEEFKKELDKA